MSVPSQMLVVGDGPQMGQVKLSARSTLKSLIVMIKIIQLWMNLKVRQYHPNCDDRNHPTVDESKYESISSK